MVQNLIKVATPMCGDEEIEAVAEVLYSGNYVSDAKVKEFEKSWASYVGTEHAVAVDSGTDAIRLTLLGMGIGPGDEVIVPALTFFATASAVLMVGATPIFADIDPDTYNLDPKDALRKLTERTTAIIPVHYFGHPADMSAFDPVSFEDAMIIEDAAQAHGAEYKGQKVGGLSDAGCWCLVGDSPITLANGETQLIVDLVENYDPSHETKVIAFDNDTFKVISSKLQAVSKRYYSGNLFTIKTKLNRMIKITENHKIPILKNGSLKWIEAKDIRERDFIAAPRSIHLVTSKRSRLPKEWFYLAGLIASDGYATLKYFCIYNSNETVLNEFRNVVKKLLPEKKISESEDNGCFRLAVSSIDKVKIINNINSNLFNYGKEYHRYWLKGYSDGDGGFTLTKTGGTLSFSTASREMSQQIQTLLLEFGIITEITLRPPTKRYWKDGHISKCKEFYLVSTQNKFFIEKFIKEIGFRQSIRSQKVKDFLEKIKNKRRWNNLDIIPIGSMLKTALINAGKPSHKVNVLSAGSVSLVSRNRQNINRFKLKNILTEILKDNKKQESDFAEIKRLVESDLIWLPVINIKKELVENKLVYDLQTEHHNFLTSFLFVHNSFYATKNITTSTEGGMVTTDNKNLDEVLRILRNHGMTDGNTHSLLGGNNRMSEIGAAVGLVQLQYLDRFNEARAANSIYLRERLEGVPWLKIPPVKDYATRHAWFWCPIEVDELKLGMTTLQLRKRLYDAGVETRHRYTAPLYRQPVLEQYRRLHDYSRDWCPVAERVCGKLLGIPNHPKLDQESLDRIVEVVKSI